jgi:hypothetical protein
MTNTVAIKDQEWPVKLSFSAMKMSLPLFGLKYVTDFDKMLGMLSHDGQDEGKGTPAEAVVPFIRNVIKAGLSFTQDKREPPSEEDIEYALDENMGFYVQVIQALAPAEEEGKKKPRTTKR